jgi:hypothetical protein
MNSQTSYPEVAMLADHPRLPLADSVRIKLIGAIRQLEDKLARDLRRPGFVEYSEQQLLGEEEYRIRKREDGEERAVDFFHDVFCLHFEAYLDNRFEYPQIRFLLPWMYAESLERTFVLKWPRDHGVDWDSSRSRFSTMAGDRLSSSQEWSQFIRQLVVLAENAGRPEEAARLSFDELVGNRPPGTPESRRTRPSKQKRQLDPTVQQIKSRVRKLRAEGLSHQQICERLGTGGRPPHAGWRELSWPVAYKHHTAAVTKWISEASADLPSLTI